jgi:hypothetical protein
MNNIPAANDEKAHGKDIKSLRVVNIGLESLYDALVKQGVQAAQIAWRPPVKQSAEILNLLDQFM